MNTNPTCFICNTRNGVALRNASSLFGEDLSVTSGKSFTDVIGDIVDKQIKKDNSHTNIICKKCQKAVVEYDALQVRLKSIKVDLLSQFKKSLEKHNINYDTYNIIIKTETKPTELKKLVLPASKLQPLPPDFVIRGGKWPITRPVTVPKLKPIMTIPSSNINLKVTVGSSVLTQSINTLTSKQKTMQNQIIDPKIIMTSAENKKEQKNMPIIITNSMKPDEILSSSHSTYTFSQPISTNSQMLSFNVNSLTKDFFSSAILTKVDEFCMEKMKKEDTVDSDGENNEESMEIDEDCSLAVITTNNKNGDKLTYGDDIKTECNEEYVDIKLVGEEGQCFMGKLQILADQLNEQDNQAIVVESDNILRVMSGQKFLYGDSEISLVMPDNLDNNDDNGDSQDSNDESQIELQVSGDEETANAIIAAAKEQGGAFIKVESGEMFHVKSVESKTDDDINKTDNTIQIVVHENDQFRCLLCKTNENIQGEAFTGDADTTMAHLKTIHSARAYICNCGHVVRKRADYVKHIEQHAQENNKNMQITDKSKMHECNICQKTYTSRTLLSEHLKTHSGSPPHECRVCGKTFASKYTHQSHLKTHLVRPRPFQCNQCGKSFFTTQNLNQHEKTHSGIKDFICNICGKAFGTQHNLEVHGVVHSNTKPYVCGVCGKAFARRAEVRDHMRTHTGERPFTCDICGARFTQRSNLHSHRRATHLDDKRYHCTMCSKRFKRRRLLDYHVKASHTGERPLKCEICRATFVYPEHYKKHARIHSGEKPYSCEVCGKSFNSRDNRNTHRFVHSDRKPYECVVCGAGYMRKQLLYHHMNTSGHLAESIVVNQPRVTKLTDNVITTQSIIVDTSKSDKFSETIYEDAEGDDKTVDSDNTTKFFITDDKKIVLQDGKSINLVQEGEEPTLLTLHNIEGNIKSEGTILDNVSTDHLTDQQTSNAIQLVPVELPDGSSGWVALNS